MKKALISLGALVLSGVILSSCSFGGGAPKIKAPKKGKAVDKISTTIAGDPFELNKTDDYKDVFAKIYSTYHYLDIAEEGYITAFETINTIKSDYKETNKILNERKVYDKASEKMNTTNYTDNYSFYCKKDNVTDICSYNNRIRYGKGTSTSDKSSEINDMDYKETYYGKSHLDTSSKDYSFVEASITKGKTNYSEKDFTEGESEINNGNISFYLEGSGKTTDEDYNTRYTAKIPNLYNYTYSKATKVSDIDTVYGPEVSLSNFAFDETFKDLMEYSFELTDSEIILKAKGNFTVEAQQFAYYKCQQSGDTSESTVYNYLKDNTMKNEYKGSYTEVELWIKYDQKYVIKNNDYTYLSYTYYNQTTYNKYNISEELTKARLENYLDEAIINDYIGKKYTKKGMSSQVTTYKYNEPTEKVQKQYDKKASKLIKEAKKNNLLKDLVIYKS